MKRAVWICVLVTLVSLSFAVTEVRISGWPGNPIEEGVILKNVEEFNASQKDIKVEWQPIPGDFRQMLTTQFSAGTAPDLFYVEAFWFEELALLNMLLPLDTYVKRDNFPITDYYDSLLQAFTLNSRLYGIPKDFSTLALYYNKEIFDTYKVAYPTSEDTWFDFLDKALQLKRAGVETPLVLAADFNRVIPFILGAGGRLVDEQLNTALAEKESRFGIEFYMDLVNKYKVAQEPANVGAGWDGEAFGKESVAMAMTGPWGVGFLQGQYPEVWAKTKIVEMPRLINQSTMAYTVSWSINRNTANRDAAWEVLKYLVTKGQERFVRDAGVLASNKKIAEADTVDYKQVFYVGAQYSTPWMVSTPKGVFSRAHDQINSKLKDLFYQRISLQQMLEEIKNGYTDWVQ